MRKITLLESLFYKTNICLQKTATCIGLQAEQVWSVIDIFNIFFSVLGVTFMLPFLCCFQNLHLLVIKKKIEIIFGELYFHLYELKNFASHF